MVYFRFMRSTRVGTISLLGMVKPHSGSEVQVVQWAADIADGLGADMGVDLPAGRQVSVVLLLACPSRV